MPRGQSKCECKIDWLWVRSPLEDMKYLFIFIFSFLRSGVEAKRGLEFRNSTRNASSTRQEVGNGESQHYVPSAYLAVCGIQREAVFFKFHLLHICSKCK